MEDSDESSDEVSSGSPGSCEGPLDLQGLPKAWLLHGFSNGGLRDLWRRVTVPKGSIVVPLWGSYVESYKVIPERSYCGAHG